MTSLDETHFATRLRILLRLTDALQCCTHFHAQTILKVIVLVLVLGIHMHIQTIMRFNCFSITTTPATTLRLCTDPGKPEIKILRFPGPESPGKKA